MTQTALVQKAKATGMPELPLGKLWRIWWISHLCSILNLHKKQSKNRELYENNIFYGYLCKEKGIFFLFEVKSPTSL